MYYRLPAAHRCITMRHLGIERRSGMKGQANGKGHSAISGNLGEFSIRGYSLVSRGYCKCSNPSSSFGRCPDFAGFRVRAPGAFSPRYQVALGNIPYLNRHTLYCSRLARRGHAAQEPRPRYRAGRGARRVNAGEDRSQIPLIPPFSKGEVRGAARGPESNPPRSPFF